MTPATLVAPAVRLKILCLCEGGNVRSSALAFVLKNEHGQDAVALGWRFASPETLNALCEWADNVFVMQREFLDKVPESFHVKVVVADVGPDRYGTPFHPELLAALRGWASKWAEEWTAGGRPSSDFKLAADPESAEHLARVAAGHQVSIIRAFNAIYWEAGCSGGTWTDTRFLNVPVAKYPSDLWVYQEIIVETRPEVIVETGTAFGGSALFYATLCETLGLGEVVSVDVRAGAGDHGEVERPKHPRITYVTGSSIDPEVVARVRDLCRGRRVLVSLDSDHHRDHVLAEMRAYAPLVQVDGYMVVEDGIINGNPVYPESGPGPTEAIEAFFEECDDFRVDERRERFMLTQNPCGWLRRVSSDDPLAGCIGLGPECQDYDAALIERLKRDLTGMDERDPSLASFKTQDHLPAPFDEDARARGLDWPERALTMVGLRRLQNVQDCVADVVARKIPGDLVECGVWRGGTAILMAAMLRALGAPAAGRRTWVADSFRGCPPPACPQDAEGTDFSAPEFAPLAVPLAEVRENFERFGLLDDRVRFLEGWFEDTLPSAPIERLAVLRVDGDLYGSTTCALENLYDRVSVGGFVIVDDFFALEQTRRATVDFRRRRGIRETIHRVDDNVGFWVKKEGGAS